MTTPSIALADLLEKGADTDLLREMTGHMVERVMQYGIPRRQGAAAEGVRREQHRLREGVVHRSTR